MPVFNRRAMRLNRIAILSSLIIGAVIVLTEVFSGPSVRGAIEMDHDTMLHLVDEGLIPVQATAVVPRVPTPSTEDTWRIAFRAFPDTVGMGGYACPGCDGVFAQSDRMGATGRRLQPLLASISEPGNPNNVYWIGRLDREDAAIQEVYLQALVDVPPPYEIRLITMSPLGYRLCPNSPAFALVDQSDFDMASGGSPNAGRYITQEWYFWRCGIEGE